MLKHLLPVLGICAALHAGAQHVKTYTVQPGQRVYDAVPPAERYLSPEFPMGIVQFRNNRVGGGRMSYNKLLAAVEFIDERGDTLTLSNPGEIRWVKIGEDSFFVDKYYLQRLDRKQGLVLAKLDVIMISNHRRIGAMGQATDASADAYTTLSASGRPLRDMTAQELLTYKEHITYFMGDRTGTFKQVNRKNLSAMFGNHRKQLEKYLDEQKPDFFLEKDMLQLLDFLASLQ
jgi:hypothetical protein